MGERWEGIKKLTSEHTGYFERAFEVSGGWLPEDVDGHGFSVVDVFEAHECLDEEGLSEFKVYVHDGHHGNPHIG